MSPSQRFRLSAPLRKAKKVGPATAWPEIPHDAKVRKLLGPPPSASMNSRHPSNVSTGSDGHLQSSTTSNGRLQSLTSSESSTEPRSPLNESLGEDDPRVIAGDTASPGALREDYHARRYERGNSPSRNTRNHEAISRLYSGAEPDSTSVPVVSSQEWSHLPVQKCTPRKGWRAALMTTEPSREALRDLRRYEQSQTAAVYQSPKESTEFSSLFPAPGFGRKTTMPSAHGSTSQPQRKAETSLTQSNPLECIQAAHGSPAYYKVNIRRPKAGVQHWFDEEDDSSDEDLHSEPALQQNFVDGIESAFQEGPIRSSSTLGGNGRRLPNSASFLDSPSAPTVTSLRSSSAPMTARTLDLPGLGLGLRLQIPQITSGPCAPPCYPNRVQSRCRRKPRRFEGIDWRSESVLCLSSSEDEGEESEQSRRQRPSSNMVRDSLVIDGIDDSQVEIGTAQAVSKRLMALQPAAPHVKRFKSVLDYRREQSRDLIAVPARGSSRLHTHWSYRSSLTPIDTPSSSSSTPTEDAKGDNTWDDSAQSVPKLMSVNQQEGVLLAAIRCKRASMRRELARASTHSDSTASTANLPLHHPKPNISVATLTLAEYLDRGLTMSETVDFRDSYAAPNKHRSDPFCARTSVATFRTNRASATTFQTNSTPFEGASIRSSTPLPGDHGSEPATPADEPPFDLGSQRSSGHERRLTASSSNYYGPSRRRTGSSHIVVLDDLDSPKFDTRSQDFIEWPYSGWDNRASLALAHRCATT